LKPLFTITLIAIVSLSTRSAIAVQDDLYRAGQRAVLEPTTKTERDDAGVTALFATRYQSSGRPRIAVYWNRILSPELADRPSASLTIRDQAEEELRERDGSASDELRKGGDTKEVGWTRNGTARITVAGAPRDEQSRRAMQEADDWAIQGAFVRTIADSGARLVDRSTIVRLTQYRDRAGEEANRKTLEMAALSDHAELLLEVQVTRDAKTFSGWGFRVELKDLRDGMLMTSIYTAAQPANAASTSFRTTDRGFERVTIDPTPADVGHELAIQVMADLAKRLH